MNVDVEALKTAAAINLPQTGQVTISETEPGQKPLPRSAVALMANQNVTLELKNTRSNVIEAVKNARQVPLTIQDHILAEIALIPERYDLIRVDFIRHAHGVGSNWSGTVDKIS